MRQLKPCGTSAAHRRHERHGEPIDALCRENETRRHREYRDANRDAVNARRRQRRREKAAANQVPVLFDPAAAEVVTQLIARYAPHDAGLLADVLGLRLAA